MMPNRPVCLPLLLLSAVLFLNGVPARAGDVAVPDVQVRFADAPSALPGPLARAMAAARSMGVSLAAGDRTGQGAGLAIQPAEGVRLVLGGSIAPATGGLSGRIALQFRF